MLDCVRRRWHYIFLLAAALITMVHPSVIVISSLSGSDTPFSAADVTDISVPIYVALDVLCVIAFVVFAVRKRRSVIR